MYTGSHLKLILTILIVPTIFILLIATDVQTRDFENELELTVEEISLNLLTMNFLYQKKIK